MTYNMLTWGTDRAAVAPFRVLQKALENYKKEVLKNFMGFFFITYFIHIFIDIRMWHVL